jgi:hypothetical protein
MVFTYLFVLLLLIIDRSAMRCPLPVADADRRVRAGAEVHERYLFARWRCCRWATSARGTAAFMAVCGAFVHDVHQHRDRAG